jgi:hypothetical protein
MNITEILDYVKMAYPVDTPTDAQLLKLIPLAVRFYSRFNPTLRTYVIETKSDKHDYDIPKDCIGIEDAYYWPGGEPGGGSIINNGSEVVPFFTSLPIASWDQYSLTVINDIATGMRQERNRGRCSVEGRKLILTPTPTQSGVSVVIKYRALHPIEEDRLPTVPESDLDIIVNLVVAEILTVELIRQAVSPDYTEGATRMSFGRSVRDTKMTATDLRQTCIDRYAHPVGAI